LRSAPWCATQKNSAPKRAGVDKSATSRYYVAQSF
jgi:hypothetical protein